MKARDTYNIVCYNNRKGNFVRKGEILFLISTLVAFKFVYDMKLIT